MPDKQKRYRPIKGTVAYKHKLEYDAQHRKATTFRVGIDIPVEKKVLLKDMSSDYGEPLTKMFIEAFEEKYNVSIRRN